MAVWVTISPRTELFASSTLLCSVTSSQSESLYDLISVVQARPLWANWVVVLLIEVFAAQRQIKTMEVDDVAQTVVVEETL